MKRVITFFLILAMIFSLCACDHSSVGSTENENSETQTELESQTTIQEGTHSALYNENYTVEQVIEYFNEVVLNVEYTEGDGDSGAVQKWIEPIYYSISGEMTQTDEEVLEGLFAQLNEIDGFPGIYPASETDTVNLTIHFYNYHDFNVNMGEVVNFELSDGAAQYWYYNDTNNIYEARIGYRTDIDQFTRNSVLLEEVVNNLGLGDSTLREDSIVYQKFSETQELSDMDWIIIKLLYSPEITCGMNQDECREVIEKLYY